MRSRRPQPRTPVATALPVGRRVGLWLALFAMLAIYLGALVSQVRAAQAPLPPWLTELACDHGQGEGKALFASHPPAPASNVDACGYCSLLSTSPGLQGSVAFAAIEFLVGVAPERTLRLGLPGEPALFPGARPRAPPASS